MSLTTNVSDLATAVGTELKAHKVLINGNAVDLAALTTTAKADLVSALNEVKGEVDSLEDAVASASGIDDGTTSTTTAWSSSKVAAELDGKATTVHTHATADVTGLDAALAGTAAAVHTHAVADTTGLQAALDGKSDTGHAHTVANVTDFAAEVDARIETRLDVSTADLDTFREVAAALADNDSVVAGINTALANRVRVDAAQTLTSGVGGQQETARNNIGAAAAADLGNVAVSDPVAAFNAALQS